jgi:hypothetical protein
MNGGTVWVNLLGDHQVIDVGILALCSSFRVSSFINPGAKKGGCEMFAALFIANSFSATNVSRNRFRRWVFASFCWSMGSNP